MKTVVQRLCQMVLSSRAASDESSAIKSYMENLTADGLWDDIDLSGHKISNFRGGHHLGRITAMCAEYDRSGNEKYAEAVKRALRGFDAANVSALNWWQNEIGMPMEAVNIYALSEQWIDSESAEILQKIIRQPLDRSAGLSSSFTGQNLLWRSRIALAKGCLMRDEKLTSQAAEEIHGVIKIGEEEGGQIDGSFLQHGPLLYSHGYGRAFTCDCASLATLLMDTPWQLTQDNLDALAVIALDGQQWMMRGAYLDFHPTGREISRPDATSAKRYHTAAGQLALADAARAGQYADWQNRIDGKAPLLVGNKYYWRSEYMVHQTEQMYFSAKLLSSRTRQIESINDENIWGAGLSAGATCLMREGDEYYNIFPLWDWTRLPGATIDSHVGREAMRFGQRGLDNFAGGVSDGKIGVAAMIYRRPRGRELIAKKAYFAFDEGVVCLGADIYGGDGPVLTGVQQCWLAGDVTVDSQTMSAGIYDLNGARVVSHDGLKYLFSEGQNVRLNFGRKEADWRVINEHRPLPESGDVFGLWIDHGPRPDPDLPAGYDYTILAQSVDADKNPLKILRNDGRVQAVIHKETNTVQAVFYMAGELALPDGGKLKSSQPCIVMLKPSGDKTDVYVSDPLQRLGILELELSGDSKDVVFPHEQKRGSTVLMQW